MGTEQDKTNAAVVATMLALGAAAMVGGSAALVALARGEIRDFSQESQGFANLTSIGDLKAAQRQRLESAKLPVSKAKAQVVADLQRDPSLASPPAPEPAPSEGVAPEGSVAPEGTAVPGGTAAPGASAPGAPGSPTGTAPATPEDGAAPAPETAPKGGKGALPTEPKTPTGTPAP